MPRFDRRPECGRAGESVARRRSREDFQGDGSGAQTDRTQLRRALSALGKGDVLLVTRLDRLARSTRDLLNTLDAIAKAGAGFRSLADAWADTTTPHGRFNAHRFGRLGRVRARVNPRARTSDGRRRVKAQGVPMGRPPKLTRHQREEALHDLAKGKTTRADLARRYNVSRSTISTLAS